MPPLYSSMIPFRLLESATQIRQESLNVTILITYHQDNTWKYSDTEPKASTLYTSIVDNICIIAVGRLALFIAVCFIVVLIVLFLVTFFTLTFVESEGDELVSKLSVRSRDLTRAGRTVSTNSTIRTSRRGRRRRGRGQRRRPRRLAGGSRGLAVAVGADDMRELAALGRALAPLRKVGALAHVLPVAVEAPRAVAEHGEVAADALARADADVRERAARARAAAVVREVDAERRALGRGFVRERAGLGGVWAGALEERPADRYLGRVVLVHARKASVTGTCVSGRGAGALDGVVYKSRRSMDEEAHL